jgi:MFS family permease
LLATGGLGAVTYALIEFPNRAAHAPHLILLVALSGAAALAGFLVVEARSRAPMVSLALFRSRNFSGANLLTLFLYAALGGMLFFLPMNLIQVQHDSATEAGAALLPLVVLIFTLSRWSGGLVARYGARLPLTIGPLIFAAGVALFARQGVGGRYWTTVFPATVVMGFGMTLCVAPLTTTVMNAVDQAEAGVASGVNNAVSRIGGLLAVAVFGVILLAGFNRGLDRRLDRLALSPQARQQADAQRPLLAAVNNPDPRVQRAVAESFVVGYRWVIWVSVALAVASSGCAFCWIDSAPQT